MKLLYFGTICSSELHKTLLSRSEVKPSAAPFIFESALLDGFKKNGADVRVFSFPSLPAYPKSSFLRIKKISEELDCGIPYRTIPSVNLPFFKQIGRQISSHRILKKQLAGCSNEKPAVLLYSIYPPVAKSILSLCKKYGAPCLAIIPDLPKDMFKTDRLSLTKKLYVRSAEKLQGQFDGYVYLTNSMKDIINPRAPYTVVEGICGSHHFPEVPKSDCRSVMYAGALNEKMGIKTLIDEFMKIPDKDIALWLFGSGDCKNYIESASKKDSRIKYFGHKSHDEILHYQKKAHLLINPRNPFDEYTKYSFPSKIIEYMASGTPLLTTKLPGIPDEYFDYCFTTDSLGKGIAETLSLPENELSAVGSKAREFILNNKNAYTQSQKILHFIKKECDL